MTTLGARASGRTRLALIYGSAAPHLCGVESSTVIMHSALKHYDMAVERIDLGAWRISQTAALLRRVSAHSPDVILIAYPTLAFDRGLGPILFSLLQRIAPLIVVVHEFSHVHVLRRLAISALVARAALVVVTTEEEKASLLGWNSWLARRIAVNPIPSNIPRREWLPSPECEIIMFGQIRPDKGIEAFLTCCDLLAKAKPDLRFRIVGSEVPRFADYAAHIRREAAKRNVEVLENLTNDAVADSFARATVALLPFPDGATERRSSLMAALACGVPIVTTKGPSTPKTLDLAMAPADDYAQLVRYTLDYSTDPASRLAAHRRSVRVAEQFSTPTVIGPIAGWIQALRRDGVQRPYRQAMADKV